MEEEEEPAADGELAPAEEAEEPVPVAEDEAADAACLALADADLVAAGGTRPRSTSGATLALSLIHI